MQGVKFLCRKITMNGPDNKNAAKNTLSGSTCIKQIEVSLYSRGDTEEKKDFSVFISCNVWMALFQSAPRVLYWTKASELSLKKIFKCPWTFFFQRAQQGTNDCWNRCWVNTGQNVMYCSGHFLLKFFRVFNRSEDLGEVHCWMVSFNIWKALKINLLGLCELTI